MKKARFACLPAGFGALLALAACATAPVAPAPTAPEAAGPGTPARSQTAILLARAGGADAPDFDAVRRAIGEADVARQDGAGAIATYRAETCSLVLVFAAREGRMRLESAQPRARRDGEAAPEMEACVEAVRTRRSVS